MNTAFFSALSAAFLTYRERHGEEQALEFMDDLFATRLKPLFDSEGFTKGNPADFARLVTKNDKDLGLEITLDVTDTSIVYCLLKDPFPALKGKVDPRKFDATYLRTKVHYLLGQRWSFKTTQHLWEGNPVTEHVIEKH